MASFISAFRDDLKQHPLVTQVQSSIDSFLATSEHATVWVIVSALAAMVLAATLVRPVPRRPPWLPPALLTLVSAQQASAAVLYVRLLLSRPQLLPLRS